MPTNNVNYTDKINELLTEMPDFVTDFIYNFGRVENYATKLEYCRDIKVFLEFMVNFLPEYSDKTIKDITLNDIANVEILDINRFLTTLSGKHKETTVKRKRASLSSMYGFFVSTGKVSRNPIAATHTIKIPEKEVIYLTNDEQRLLLQTVRSGNRLSDNASKVHYIYEDRDSALFLLLLDTGLRVSEMLSTDIQDYNLEDCSVVVVRKGGDTQIVYFSDECRDYLDVYFSAQKVKYSLRDLRFPAFTTSTGTRLGVRAVEMLVKKYVTACLPEKAKIISPHKLRSSFAMSFYAASNNDILLLKKKMNHKSIQTTNIYAKASDTAMKESRSILQGLR
ncbi:tyrosine-type recombinase/integrase [Butyrivibrio proteoclasticus]|uniref:tyrosine-type recombinase/integrase n=1 Tax=Butyrivibrio proteoclasticus TaxID=43305 RepID=UPI00047DA58B|nr:tyrosine-type recombinase/integrase [Butyrivibrio proteoclasticus]